MNKHFDFSEVHRSMEKVVNREILAGVSYALVDANQVLDLHCEGWADREKQIKLGEDHLFRVFSNTKLVTSLAVMILVQRGKLELDAPIAEWLPQFAHVKVLKENAKNLDDTEPARQQITVRHLLSHRSGLGYGLLDHGSILYRAYVERRVLNAYTTLADMIEVLAPLPLKFHPGEGWEYSIATDVLSRLIEVVSGQRFDHFISEQIFEPLEMIDTSFVVQDRNFDRFCAYYAGSDPGNILQRGLKRIDNSPYPGAFLTPVARLSGGGGLVSSLHDMIKLMRVFLKSGTELITPKLRDLMMTNDLPQGQQIQFPGLGPISHKGFGLGGAVTLTPEIGDDPRMVGEFEWGGIAGTHWWVSPQTQTAGIVMTQRLMAFWHPYYFDLKKAVYRAI